MTAPPDLFEPALRAARRERAARAVGPDGHSAFEDAAYLHRRAAADFAERLSLIPRAFPDTVILGAAGGLYADAVRDRFGVRRLREFDSAPSLAQARRGVLLEAEAPLPLDEASADLVLSCFELHGVNDPVGRLVQARRALRPDGLFLGCLIGGESLSALRAAFAEAEIETTGGLSPRVAPMIDLRSLGDLVARAGFALPVVDSDAVRVWHPSPLALLRDLRAMGESNALRDRRRRPLRRDTLAHAMALYQERCGRADGAVHADFEILHIIGWAPAASQPQPLRPGSASARLADALGAKEQSAGETAPALRATSRRADAPDDPDSPDGA